MGVVSCHEEMDQDRRETEDKGEDEWADRWPPDRAACARARSVGTRNRTLRASRATKNGVRSAEPP